MKSKVLLIDDSVTIHRVIDLSIDLEKYEIVKVFSKEDAELKLNSEQFNYILLDNKLDHIVVNEYVEQLKQEQPKASVILLVGAFDKFDDTDLEKTGADDYLVKPFDSQSLNAKLAADVDIMPASIVEKIAEADTIRDSEDYVSPNINNDGQQVNQSFAEVLSKEEYLDNLEEVLPEDLTDSGYVDDEVEDQAEFQSAEQNLVEEHSVVSEEIAQDIRENNNIEVFPEVPVEDPVPLEENIGNTGDGEDFIEKSDNQDIVVEEQVEAPVMEEVSVSDPIVSEEPAIENESVLDEAVEAPVTEDSAVEEEQVGAPVMEEITVSEPIAEETAIENEPVLDEAVETPVTEDAAVEEEQVEAPVMEEVSVSDPIISEEPAIENEPMLDEVVEAPVTEDIVEEEQVDIPVTEEVSVSNPIIEEPVIESEPVLDEAVETLVTEDIVVEEEQVDIPVTEEVVSEGIDQGIPAAVENIDEACEPVEVIASVEQPVSSSVVENKQADNTNVSGITINISRDEILSMLGNALDKQFLEEAVKEIIANNMKEIVKNVVPRIAEKHIREELERLKNDE